jgi:hypothetical protein
MKPGSVAVGGGVPVSEGQVLLNAVLKKFDDEAIKQLTEKQCFRLIEAFSSAIIDSKKDRQKLELMFDKMPLTDLLAHGLKRKTQIMAAKAAGGEKRPPPPPSSAQDEDERPIKKVSLSP